MRIASLLPSATEIVCALGLESDLVAVTHECDYPLSVKGKPVVTSSVIPDGETSAGIDRHIRRMVHQGSSIYRLDAERLAALQPDLVLTQELCEVCAVSYPIVEAAARRLGGATQLVSLEPQQLSDVFDHLRLVGRLTGTEEQAERVVRCLQARLDRVRERLQGRPPRRVVFLEWIDPLFGSGHWNPELVGLAGGRDQLGNPGKPAAAITWEAVMAAAPDAIVVAACGLPLARALREVSRLQRLPGWDKLEAVGRGDVYLIDGNAYFSRPGPRLADSVEILAGLLHPGLIPPPSPEAASRLA